MLIYCTFSDDNEYLTIDITDVLTAGYAATDPARAGHLLHQVIRVLNVLLEQGDLGRVLLIEELLRNSTALLAQAHLLRVQESALDIGVTTTITHERDGVVGAGLRADITLMRVEYRLITESAVSVDERVVVTVALPGIDIELSHGYRVHAGCLGHEVSSHVVTGADALGVEGLQPTLIVTRVGKSVKSEATCHSNPWQTK